MKLKGIREENPVDSLISLLRSGKYSRAKIKLGQLRGDPKEFTKLYNYLTKNTKLEDVELKINAIRAKVECMSCDWRGDPDIQHNSVRCPRCYKDVKVLSGDEMEIHV